MRFTLNSFLLIFITCSGAYAQLLDDASQMLITYKDLAFFEKKKKTNLRFNLSVRNEHEYLLEVMNTEKLPRNFKKFRVVTSSGSRISFTKNEALTFANVLIDSQVHELIEDTVFFKDTQSKRKLTATYKRNLLRYFSGSSAGPFYKYNKIPLYNLVLDSPHQIILEARGKFSKLAQYKTDVIPVGYASRFPALDTNQCLPLNRFHELRKLKGYGIDKFKYEPYRIPTRQTVKQHFEIYFDKNSAQANPESLQPIVDYLRMNNYSILQATIEGYSSVEGDDQRNIKLQKKRARVLLDALQQYNNEPILSDTLIIFSGYELFRQHIKGTEFQWLDTLSNENIKKAVHTNSNLLSGLEPYLKPQRKAVLRLVVAKRIEGAEVISQFKADFTRVEKLLDPKFQSGVSPTDAEAKVMGMFIYLNTLIEKNLISPLEASGILDNSVNNKVVRVLYAYHSITQFESKAQQDSLLLSNVNELYDYGKLFVLAQTNLLDLIKETSNIRLKEKYKQQLVDIQAYCFDYVLKHWIPIKTLCDMEYPDQPEYRGYKLNQLAFLQYLTQFDNVPCETLRVPSQPEVRRYTDQWLDIYSKREQKPDTSRAITATLQAEPQFTQDENPILRIRKKYGRYYPSFGEELYSPLLFYLKKLFIKDEATIKPYVKASDDLIEFDVYTLANHHVSEWDVAINYYADKEVQLLEMDKAINLLKSINKRVCKSVVNQLYLDYHLKALHYLSRYFEPGNTKHAAIAQQSLYFITDYYTKHAGMITPRLSSYLLLQLNAFQEIPGEYAGSWYGWNILKAIQTKRMLSGNEIILFDKYNRYYNPH